MNDKYNTLYQIGLCSVLVASMAYEAVIIINGYHNNFIIAFWFRTISHWFYYSILLLLVWCGAL